jgi:ubiquinone/menaquinone biosynthesis C-methylase UbiE
VNAHSESSLQVIEDLARPTAHDGLLDLETGVGDVAFAFAGSVKSVEAVDDRAEMIDEAGRLAREMKVSGVVFRRADLYALPFDDRAFSLVVCRNGLHRLPEPVAALKEAARVLSPGGRMVVFETSVSEVVDRPLNELAKLREPAHRRYYRLDGYRGLFEKAGLRVDEEREDRRTVDLDYWLEAAGASHEHREIVQSRLQELPVRVQGAMDLAFADQLVSFSYDVVGFRLSR